MSTQGDPAFPALPPHPHSSLLTTHPPDPPLPTDNLPPFRRLPHIPSTPPNLSHYTPSTPCLHCTLTSSPRCSLKNLHKHSQNRQPKPIPPPLTDVYARYMYDRHRDSTWYTHRYYSQNPEEPIRGLETRCKRCVRDGVWCVLRQVGGMDVDGVWEMYGKEDGEMNGDGEGEGEGELTRKRERERDEMGGWVEDGVGGWVKVGNEGSLRGKGLRVELDEGKESDAGDGGGHGGQGDYEGSSGSPGSASQEQERAEISNDSWDRCDDVDELQGKISSGSKRFKRGAKSGNSMKFSKDGPILQRGNSTSTFPDLVNYDADADTDAESDNTDLNSDDDDDSDLDFDIKSNASSKTSFSRRSMKSLKSIASPLLTPTSSPVITRPESPLSHPPPPEPPEPTPDDMLEKDTSWSWKENEWTLATVEIPKRKPFTRENHISTPLFAAVTAVEITKSDLTNLISPSFSKTGIHRFLTSKLGTQIPFVTYVRSPGLSYGQEGQEQLLQIVHSQILDSLLKYERTEYRRKEGLMLVEGWLPLECRLGNKFLTQEDLQNQFALPSWQRKGLEFLSEGMVEMRRRKEMEEIREQRRLEQNKEDEEMIKGWKMEEEQRRREEEMVRRLWGGEMEVERKEEEEYEEDGEHQIFTGLQSLVPDTTDTKPPKAQPAPDPALGSDPDPDLKPPSTPTAYFSLRLSCLHNFWTQQAQPIDFEFAKLVKTNTFRKWRGERLKPFNGNWPLPGLNKETPDGAEDVVNTGGPGSIDEWLDTLDSIQSVLDQEQIRKQKATVMLSKATGAAEGMTHQELADTGLISFKAVSPYPPSEPEWRLVADDMAVMSAISDDEDILRFIGEDYWDDRDYEDSGEEDGDGVKEAEDKDEDEVEDKDEDEVEEKGEDEELDKHPLIDYFRESITNKS